MAEPASNRSEKDSSLPHISPTSGEDLSSSTWHTFRSSNGFDDSDVTLPSSPPFMPPFEDSPARHVRRPGMRATHGAANLPGNPTPPSSETTNPPAAPTNNNGRPRDARPASDDNNNNFVSSSPLADPFTTQQPQQPQHFQNYGPGSFNQAMAPQRRLGSFGHPAWPTVHQPQGGYQQPPHQPHPVGGFYRPATGFPPAPAPQQQPQQQRQPTAAAGADGRRPLNPAAPVFQLGVGPGGQHPVQLNFSGWTPAEAAEFFASLRLGMPSPAETAPPPPPARPDITTVAYDRQSQQQQQPARSLAAAPATPSPAAPTTTSAALVRPAAPPSTLEWRLARPRPQSVVVSGEHGGGDFGGPSPANALVLTQQRPSPAAVVVARPRPVFAPMDSLVATGAAAALALPAAAASSSSSAASSSSLAAATTSLSLVPASSSGQPPPPTSHRPAQSCQSTHAERERQRARFCPAPGFADMPSAESGQLWATGAEIAEMRDAARGRRWERERAERENREAAIAEAAAAAESKSWWVRRAAAATADKMRGGGGESSGSGRGGDHVYSSNYRGDTENPKNASADIPDEANCALWLVGLPVDCTHQQLLGSIARRYPRTRLARLYATVINEPNLEKNHPRAAAKLVFWNREGAQMLYELAELTRGLRLDLDPEHWVHVTWNRIKSAPQQDLDEEVVGQAFWSDFEQSSANWSRYRRRIAWWSRQQGLWEDMKRRRSSPLPALGYSPLWRPGPDSSTLLAPIGSAFVSYPQPQQQQQQQQQQREVAYRFPPPNRAPPAVLNLPGPGQGSALIGGGGVFAPPPGRRLPQIAPTFPAALVTPPSSTLSRSRSPSPLVLAPPLPSRRPPPSPPRSRVLHVFGPRRVVNWDSLRADFETRFQFELEKVHDHGHLRELLPGVDPDAGADRAGIRRLARHPAVWHAAAAAAWGHAATWAVDHWADDGSAVPAARHRLQLQQGPDRSPASYAATPPSMRSPAPAPSTDAALFDPDEQPVWLEITFASFRAQATSAEMYLRWERHRDGVTVEWGLDPLESGEPA